MKAFVYTLKHRTKFKDYYFECPSINLEKLAKKRFEFVIVNAKSDLENRETDEEAFEEHFSDQNSVTFANLGTVLQNPKKCNLGKLHLPKRKKNGF